MEMEIELPIKKVKASCLSPRKLVIFSKPKVGKTSALANLEKSLILDLERGTDFLDAVKLPVFSLSDIRDIGETILSKNKPYKYIVCDTVTKLEDMSLSLALDLYMSTPIGKNFEGTNVLTLPQGAGYLYLRLAMEKLINYIDSLADRVIYAGHIKTKFLEKNGKEVQALELDLTGKIKSWMSANADAIGMLYRDGNKNILSFKTSDDVICGARSEHLKNQEIVLSEINEKTGELTTHWDRIYID
jgi:hypothetical protein